MIISVAVWDMESCYFQDPECANCEAQMDRGFFHIIVFVLNLCSQQQIPQQVDENIAGHFCLS